MPSRPQERSNHPRDKGPGVTARHAAPPPTPSLKTSTKLPPRRPPQQNPGHREILRAANLACVDWKASCLLSHALAAALDKLHAGAVVFRQRNHAPVADAYL